MVTHTGSTLSQLLASLAPKTDVGGVAGAMRAAGWPVVIGCTTSESGEIFRQRADGLMGLGRDRVSVQAQLAAAHVIDDVRRHLGTRRGAVW